MLGNISYFQCGKVWCNCSQSFVKFCWLLLITQLKGSANYESPCRGHRQTFLTVREINPSAQWRFYVWAREHSPPPKFLDTVVLLLVELIGSIVNFACLPNDEGPGPQIFFPRTATASACALRCVEKFGGLNNICSRFYPLPLSHPSLNRGSAKCKVTILTFNISRNTTAFCC